ncbi:isoleucine--tRNA ligase [Candidatus Berkelbacteria bacterium]|nr:isoleucine--tRNA ligase [Candidatus Berkelbacteria bacterium]
MKNNNFLEPLPDPRPNLPALEERILKFWSDEKIFEQSVESRPTDKPFIFFEGPPTANGRPGTHHILARTFKDVVPRYKTMRGFRVERKAGWDTHGLPVELQVEKELGISGKPQIESIVPNDKNASIAQFNKLCKESVFTYKEEWGKLTERMGFWLDLNDPYVTYENDYIESVWWVLKQVWDQKLLFQDFKVVPYCPRCGTALSSHEVAQGYEEVEDNSVFIKFKVKNQDQVYLLAWTTTPWTLPGNVALAVGRHISYGIYEVEGEQFILADDLAASVLGDPKKVRDVGFEELLSLEYEPLFAINELTNDKSYRVYEADFVTTESGTGIVHTAVMYGEDDFRLGDEVGLPKFHTVDEEGRFNNSVVGLAGLFVKDQATEQKIIEKLKANNQLYKEEGYKHTYPFCWRCNTALLYYATSSWFIRMSQLREQLLANNDQITWVPDNLKEGRFGEWLREVKDWALSRNRYWGTPLPIWECTDCGEQVCVGSRSELEQLANQQSPEDLHRPYIDQVTLSCAKCPGQMKRFPEVVDVWFDSGAMPFAQWHYPFENKEKIDSHSHFPADYIAEAIDQTRGWFYTLLAISTLLKYDSPPYKACLTFGHLLDKHGKKMSKSKGNVIDPWTIADKYGIDPLRLHFCSMNQPGDTKKLDEKDIEQVARKNFYIAWNIYSFLSSAASRSNWQPSNWQPKSEEPLDKWLVSYTGKVAQSMSESLDRYDIFRASRELIEYINKLSTWYLRLSRKRTDDGFLPTLYWSVRQLAKMMAPFSPFFAEFLWQRTKLDDDQLSVHLENWPTGEVDLAAVEQMRQLGDLVELGRAKRAEAGVKLRQPLASLKLSGQTRLDPGLESILIEELNVKKITYDDGAESLELDYDFELTPQLKAEGLSRDLARAIQQLRKVNKLKLEDRAEVVVGGEHDLLDELKKLQPQLEQLTNVKISWTNESLGEPVVDSLSIDLK